MTADVKVFRVKDSGETHLVLRHYDIAADGWTIKSLCGMTRGLTGSIIEDEVVDGVGQVREEPVSCARCAERRLVS